MDITRGLSPFSAQLDNPAAEQTAPTPVEVALEFVDLVDSQIDVVENPHTNNDLQLAP